MTLFPAWAGVIPGDDKMTPTATAFPRMGGGDPVRRTFYASKVRFSPHGRG